MSEIEIVSRRKWAACMTAARLCGELARESRGHKKDEGRHRAQAAIALIKASSNRRVLQFYRMWGKATEVHLYENRNR